MFHPMQNGLATRLRSLTGTSERRDMPVVSEVLGSDEFHSATLQLATQLRRDATDVSAEAAEYVREMGATHDLVVLKAWQRISNWLMRGYDIVVKDDELAELRTLHKQNTLIFLSSHRSYLDEFALPQTLLQSGVPCFGMAGANLDFFPFGTLARRNGIVHVRRASGDMPVYRMMLRTMVGRMVARGDNLVWSIEGGRSRTGKLRPPRYGLLRYVTDAISAAQATDALFVPVSIMYDQLPVHEVELMLSESRGGSKQPENIKWLAEYARRLSARMGRIYLDFGTPIPIYDRLTSLAAEGLSDKRVIERVALDVCHRLNQTSPVTATAAVCVAMLGQDRALTLDEVCTTVAPLAEYIRRRGSRVAGDEDLTDRAAIILTLGSLTNSGVLRCYTDGPEPVWLIGEDQHLVAAVYRNSAVHVLLVRAIAEVALVTLAQNPAGTNRTAWETALSLRELLKFDFFFAARDEFAQELWNEVALLSGTVHDAAVDMSPDTARQLLENSPLLVAHLVLRPFIDAYAIVAHQLAQTDPRHDIDEKQFFDRCLRLGRQWSLQRRIASKESISVDMFSTAMQMARHRGLVATGGQDVQAQRTELVTQLSKLQSTIDAIAAIHISHDDPVAARSS